MGVEYLNCADCGYIFPDCVQYYNCCSCDKPFCPNCEPIKVRCECFEKEEDRDEDCDCHPNLKKLLKKYGCGYGCDDDGDTTGHHICTECLKDPDEPDDEMLMAFLVKQSRFKTTEEARETCKQEKKRQRITKS